MNWPRRVGLALLALGCGDGFVPSPFVSPDAGDGGPASAAERADASVPSLPAFGLAAGQALGGPCIDDSQCFDDLPCTSGVCDQEIGACVFTGDDAICDDGVYCNGAERCDPRLGCRPGPPTSCSDSTPCTIDSCDEATRSCVRVQRDLDGDGDVDGNCKPEGDCDDLDALVSSLEPEVCANSVDDDCDGQVDEAQCQAPRFDRCDDVLELSAPGSYIAFGTGALLDYGGTCSRASPAARELVLAVNVPDSVSSDVELIARAARGVLGFSVVAACGDESADLGCSRGGILETSESVARVQLSGTQPGVRTVYLLTDSGAPVQIEWNDVAAALPATNRDCAAPDDITLGQAVIADLALAGEPLASTCRTDRTDLFYRFSLDAPQDVLLFARSLDGLGSPRISLRRDCGDGLASELGCQRAESALLRRHSLAEGDYIVGISATGPSRIELTLELSEPTPAPPSDRCETAPVMGFDIAEELSFAGHADDIAAGCSPGFLDTARRLDLDRASDVLLVGRFSGDDVGSVAVAGPGCSAASTRVCAPVSGGSARTTLRGVAEGSYWLVAESLLGLPATLSALSRPTQPVTLVPGADDCEDALSIGPAGGLFRGNTTNAFNDFSASCDFATPVPAPDQLLRLQIDQPRRLVIDTRGSEFNALVDVRRGPECPGEELERACVAQLSEVGSFLDLDLAAGEYFIQVDGYAGASGEWSLDIFLLEPRE